MAKRPTIHITTTDKPEAETVTEVVTDETETEQTETEPETEVEEDAEQGDEEAQLNLLDDEPDPTPVELIPHVNKHGHRVAMMNDTGVVTTVDDDTALILYRQPNFYRELYDPSRGKQIPTHMFYWVDEHNNRTGLQVGQPYELVV